jgi:starch phosphorylase
MGVSAATIPHLPERVVGLVGIATNLAWSWHREARALFRAIDQPLWHLTRHNPIEMLLRVDPARLEACARDPTFLAQYDRVVAQLQEAITDGHTWYARTHADLGHQPIAYYCAEFGLHNSVPIYSGGLGILAGDHCKAASDLGVPLIAVGLLYTKGYFDQRVRLDGRQEDSDEVFDPATAPLTPVLGPGGEPYLTTVETWGRPVHVGAWRMSVGRVPVYLLDTSLEVNDPEDRLLSHKLYAGGPALRLRQEWILGVGGVRVLRAVGAAPVVWHANEGHTVFMLVERLRELVAQGRPLDQAVHEVRATAIFTTHTPVPAGHDVFTREQFTQCTGDYHQLLGMDRQRFFGLGRFPGSHDDSFHMTALGMRLAGQVNGVARRHGHETRRMWATLWGRAPDAVPIRQVTNGVHVATWMNHALKALLDDHLGAGWLARMDESDLWARILELDDARLWDVHVALKARLLDFMREEVRWRFREVWRETAHLVGAGVLLGLTPLTIGFARRFAAYKRADLIFRDVDRLHRLVTDPARPVQIIFAGKAHPADDQGKAMLQRVYTFSRDPRFEGRIAFLEDYEMHLAHRLVQGVDLWLNVPRVPLEACGTSGMKAALNGIPQLGTLDGWWAEGYTGRNGWAITPAPPDADPDTSDGTRLYEILEQQVVPLFYDRDLQGIPHGWVAYMKHALHQAGLQFTAHRMVRGYVGEFYAPAIRRTFTDDAPTG